MIDVERRGDCSAVHYIMEPIMAGQHVTLSIDWARRFDHMQQHSGNFFLHYFIVNEWEGDTLHAHIYV